MRRLLRWLLTIAVLAGLGYAAAKSFEKPPLAVDVYRAARGEVRESVTSPTSGTVVSKQEARVASEVPGRVAKIVLEEGDRAETGAPVVLLEDADAQVEVRAAEAALATHRTGLETADLRMKKAEQDLASAEPLFEKQLMSEDQIRALRVTRDTSRVDVETARRAVREAEVAVERSQVALARRRICAPFKGVVRRKLVEVGEYVMLGTPCFEMFDDQNIFVRAPIDEVDLPRIRTGLPCDVQIEPFGERLFKGVVRQIEPGVRIEKELNRTSDVEVDLKEMPQPQADGEYPSGEGPVRVGMSADIEVVTEVRPQVLRVPAYAVHETEDLDKFVYMLGAESKIEKRTVKTGLVNWDFAEVTDGLAEGDAVIVSLDIQDLAPGKRAVIKREVKRLEVK